MQETVVGAVDNGKAYGVCQCGGPEAEREDQPLCKVEGTDPERMAIVCKDGFSLKVSKRDQVPAREQTVDIPSSRFRVHDCDSQARELCERNDSHLCKVDSQRNRGFTKFLS